MFEKLLARASQALSKHNIPYMIIGGQAVLLYGTPRLTKDIDITLGIDTNGLAEITTIAEELKLRPLVSNPEDFAKKTMVFPVQDDTSGIRIDFIFSFSPYEKQAIARSKSIEIEKTIVKFAAVEDLIIHKIFSGRPG
ncbi:MAG: nucleotidyltransferase [Planctomycetes bacterium]|nr:nucleotidyltransferase [Planctomycetota bacterium]